MTSAPMVRRIPPLLGFWHFVGASDLIDLAGDDTHHTAIPEFKVPNCFLSKAGFPASGDPEKVDVVFYDL